MDGSGVNNPMIRVSNRSFQVMVSRKTILRAEGVVSYAFQGGEPTLRGIDFFKKGGCLWKTVQPQSHQSAECFSDKRVSFGWWMVCFFKENHFLVGLSLDSIRETNDIYRHAAVCGSVFEHIFGAARLLQKHGVDFKYPYCCNRKHRCTYHWDLWILPQKRLRIPAVHRLSGSLRGTSWTNPYALSPKQYGEFLITLFHLWYKEPKKGRQPYIRQFENHIGIWRIPTGSPWPVRYLQHTKCRGSRRQCVSLWLLCTGWI